MDSADRVFVVSSLAAAVTFGACVYAFIEGSRVKTPEGNAHLPAEPSVSADESPGEDE